MSSEYKANTAGVAASLLTTPPISPISVRLQSVSHSSRRLGPYFASFFKSTSQVTHQSWKLYSLISAIAANFVAAIVPSCRSAIIGILHTPMINVSRSIILLKYVWNNMLENVRMVRIEVVDVRSRSFLSHGPTFVCLEWK
jgi:hypothetical protein